MNRIRKSLLWILTCLMIGMMLVNTAYSGEVVYYYHTDPAGTPLAMTDASGNVVWRADYLPFGEENVITGAMENDFKFVGKEQDKETGLYYFGARYMESAIGRFISPDPMGPVDPHTGKINENNLLNPQRLNRYAYSLNNPYKYIDPDGCWPTIIGKAIHQYSINRVVPPKDRNSLNVRQVAMDNDAVYSHPNLHGLSSPGQEPIEAWRIGNSFARDSIEMARNLEKNGEHEQALFHLGNAIHTMQDATSPPHQGFQVWNENWSLPEKFVNHTKYELNDPGRNSALDAATQKAWDIFRSNKPIPSEVIPRP
jgi:RHS repeat-associated protein